MFQAPRSAPTALWPILVAGLSLLAMSAVAQAAPVPDGIWYTKGEEIDHQGSSLRRGRRCALRHAGVAQEPTEADGSPKVDKLNKDPAKKNKPMVGLDILLNMKVADDHWKGKAYNPEDGKLYDITFSPKEDDTADLRGCVLGFLCQTEQFTRAKEVPGGDPTITATADAKKPHKGKVTAKK